MHIYSTGGTIRITLTDLIQELFPTERFIGLRNEFNQDLELFNS
jgi:hypothetical protein